MNSHYLSFNFVLFSVFDYNISLIELLGIVSGLFCVYLAAKNHILTWPIGIFNSICFFFLFYQVQLYSDMILQIYFFGSSIYGWMYWQSRKGQQIPITSLSNLLFLVITAMILVSTHLLGEFAMKLPQIFPNYFKLPPAFPYWDAFTTTASVVANFLLARRILQAWYFWVAVDIVCISVYFVKGIDLIAMEYTVFLFIAIFGLIHWRKENAGNFSRL